MVEKYHYDRDTRHFKRPTAVFVGIDLGHQHQVGVVDNLGRPLSGSIPTEVEHG